MRKKFVAVMLAGSMAASLAACGSSTNTKKTTEAPTTTQQETTKAAETTAAVTEAETETEEATEAETTTEEATEAETTTEEATEAETTTEEATEAETTTEEATEAETTTEEATEAETTTEEATEAETTTEEATEAETTTEEATEAETTTEEATEAETTTEEATEAEETTEGESEEETTEAEKIDGTGFKIGMVTDVGGVNDGSFNQSAWAGLQKAEEDFGCEVSYLESKTDSDYAPNIETFVDDEYDLIIITGYMLSDALSEAAELYPDQKFVIIDDTANADKENVTCMMFEQAQASYLVGLVAGMTTETDTVGFVLGMENETMNQFGYGYLAGVLDANKDAKILQYNANAFGDSAGGKTAATKMVTDGADVIFHAAGGTGLGVIDGCKEAGIWAIGVDSDQSYLAPETVLTSAMKRVDNGVYDAVKSYILGELEGGVITYDLSMGGVDIAPTTDNLSDEVLEAVEEAKQDIIDGKIVVPNNKEDFEEKYGDVYELDD